ncbi:MAG: TIGR00266 family protein [Spirochaetes bacterium]|nr:MAG: TIGR00266 family protein [Spirochaetota bacterium]
MKYQMKHQPSYTLLHLELAPGEQVKTEAGAMVYMSPQLGIETQFGSGILSAVARKFLGGESLFVNIFSAGQQAGFIGLATGLVGDVFHQPMTGKALFVQSGSYLASSPQIDVKAQFGGLRMLFGGEGFFLLKVTGMGDLFCSSYGAIIPIDVDGTYTVDTGHIVAFEESLQFNVKRVGGWKSTFLSGEGLVCEFSGKGRLWIQSRVPGGFIGWVSKLLPR